MPFLPSYFDWFSGLDLLTNWWGIIGLSATLALAIVIYFTFRHFNHLGDIVARIGLLAFFTYRVVLTTKYILDTGIWLNVVPWQISSLCFVLLPIVVLCNFPKFIKSQVALLSFFTGLISLFAMAVSPHFFEGFGTTAVLDALLSHSLLTLAPILLLVTDQIKYSFKGLGLSVILLGALTLWGYLGNLVAYPGHNIMYLEQSILPFSISGIPIVDYLLFILPVLVLFYVFMHFFHRHHTAYRERRNQRLARENVLLVENRKEMKAKKALRRKARREEKKQEKLEEDIAVSRNNWE